MNDQSDLDFPAAKKETGPVECLGQTFESDEARREHFQGLLAEKLKDPEFRETPGFPIGTNEDILRLSDPPYFTACPNPWLGEISSEVRADNAVDRDWVRAPFAADVSEGKNHSIYRAHSYHTKVPHRALMRYILHYTEPNAVILDGFAGTGMTGVAASLCADRREVEALGYAVASNGSISDDTGAHVSELGARRALLSELSLGLPRFPGHLWKPDNGLGGEAWGHDGGTCGEYGRSATF